MGYRIQNRGMAKDKSCAVSLLGNHFKQKQEAQNDARRKVSRKDGNEKLSESLYLQAILKCQLPEDIDLSVNIEKTE